ncbi:ATP-binding protein [Nocardioides mesophilus]|uniref:ATP-binding protein n=1 Tax=Nocardioides mesophilus TaxID=433659 RepID=A0A7G9R8Q3_9ACTN|nr:ATP-binding protein [Nocardioides mesophilus]QNN51978.1 ATP-binding protein [Nocardioides mesophilus]
MGATTCSSARAESFERTLPPLPSSVSEARRLFRDLLRGAVVEELVDNVAVVVSELVTNAMLHAGTPIVVVGRIVGDRVRVEIADGSQHLPMPRRYAPTAGTGRGLMLIEQLVDSWGVEHHATGKTVWCLLSADGGTAARAEPSWTSSDPLAVRVAPGSEHDGVTVRLLRMPLLLHEAWREHAEALLRECLLASLDSLDDLAGTGDLDAIQVHADATDAVALLEEQVPAADVDMDPARLMAGATEPLVSADEVRLEVPTDSVAHFLVLDEAMDRALALHRDGRVLAPPTQPEVQQFRRWVCRQVRDQADGLPPQAWSFAVDPGPASLPAPPWDTTEVEAAGAAMIAADDTNRILAASPAALELLGYDYGELVGRRLVSIIPGRFRQAHVAGFTLHLLVGRAPLLDRSVAVPALHRDGREVDVELTVSVQQTGANRRVFVALMSPIRS